MYNFIFLKEAYNTRQENNNQGQLTPCRHGAKCRAKNDPSHCRQYSHPSAAAVPKNENNYPYAGSFSPDYP